MRKVKIHAIIFFIISYLLSDLSGLPLANDDLFFHINQVQDIVI